MAEDAAQPGPRLALKLHLDRDRQPAEPYPEVGPVRDPDGAALMVLVAHLAPPEVIAEDVALAPPRHRLGRDFRRVLAQRPQPPDQPRGRPRATRRVLPCGRRDAAQRLRRWVPRLPGARRGHQDQRPLAASHRHTAHVTGVDQALDVVVNQHLAPAHHETQRLLRRRANSSQPRQPVQRPRARTYTEATHPSTPDQLPGPHPNQARSAYRFLPSSPPHSHPKRSLPHREARPKSLRHSRLFCSFCCCFLIYQSPQSNPDSLHKTI